MDTKKKQATEATLENISAYLCVNLTPENFAAAAGFIFCLRVHSWLIHNAPAFLKIRICIQATKQINGNIRMA